MSILSYIGVESFETYFRKDIIDFLYFSSISAYLPFKNWYLNLLRNLKSNVQGIFYFDRNCHP